MIEWHRVKIVERPRRASRARASTRGAGWAAALALLLAPSATADAPPATADAPAATADAPAATADAPAGAADAPPTGAVAKPAAAATRGARSSQLASGESACEFWDVIARFESGHRLFARFQITNEGPGERTAIASWQLIDASGKRTDFRNGRRESRWTLSEAGDRIEIGSSLFDQSGAMHRLEYDSTKRGIRVAVEYAPRGPVAWPQRSAPSAYPLDLLELATPARARIWLEGMPEPASSAGTIALTHTYLDDGEAALALRRIDFASTDAGPAVFVSDRTAPSGARERWLVVARAGEVLYQTSDFELDLSDADPRESGDYPTIDGLGIRGSRVEGAVRRSATLAELNPLDDIPQPFRFLLSLRSRPHRAWSSASFEIRLEPEPPKKLLERDGLAQQEQGQGQAPEQGQDPRQEPKLELDDPSTDDPETVIKGSGVTSITYTNPLPPKTTSGSKTGIPGA